MTPRPVPLVAPCERSEILSGYASWMRSWAASEQTVRARTTLAASRLAVWGVEGFTAHNVQKFLGSDPTWSKWTRATYRNHLKSFCEFLVAEGLLEVSPMADVRKVVRPGPAPRPLSEEEVVRVMATAQGRTRDWLVLALLAGLRVHEMAKIRGEDVTTEGLRVVGKGGKQAVLPTHPDIWAMTRRYPREGYWFASPYGAHITPQTITALVTELFSSLGIEGSIHRCRHVYGTRLLRAGVNIRTVQKLMRHSSLETTAAYTAVDEDELQRAILTISA